MATNTYFFPGKVYPLPGFAFNPSLGQLLVFQGRTVISQGANQQLLQLANGLELKLIGTGLQYDAQGNGIAGTITSLEVFRNGNVLVENLTGVSLDFQEFSSQAQTNGPAAFALWLMSGNDTINGSSGNDDLVGGAGNDALTGNGGNDSFNGGAGLDAYSGGDGLDTLTFESAYSDPSATQGVSLNAATQIVSDPYGNNETFNTMEAFRGTQFNDVMIGASAGSKIANEYFTGLGGQDSIDGGAGIDWVRYDRDSVRGGKAGVIVNLTTGQAIDGFGEQDTLANIENVRGTAFNDTISGNAAGNDLRGFGGSDTLNGNAGIDFLWGEGGNDTLNGGFGADNMRGGAGNDVYVVDNASDIINESLFGSNGVDTIRSTISFSLSNTARVLGSVENLTLEGSGNISVSGNTLSNVLRGNSGANILSGAAGNDTISGGLGADNMRGGAGNDVYVVDNAGDKIVESLPGSNGVDTVQSLIGFGLGNTARVLGSVENLRLLGVGNINGAGNALSNIITGNAGANNLNGAAGNDTINGGAGRDTLTGSAGKDYFVFNTALNASTNVDRITDFNVVQDTIRLDNAVMAGIGSSLTSGEFWKSTSGAAHDSTDRIIYETDTGRLLYDSNGSAAGGSVHFATLKAGLALTYADFLVI